MYLLSIYTIHIAALLGYFTAIILSGFYQNPRLSFFSSCLAAAQYCLLSLFIQKTLLAEYILPWGFIGCPVLFFILTGCLMYIYSRRNRLLMIDLKVSSEKLLKEKEERRISEEKNSVYRAP